MKPDHIITCVYCGQTYPENTPTHGADVAVLTQHISQCEKHPMRAVIRERDDCLALLGARKMELDGYVAKLAQNVKEICELKEQLAQAQTVNDKQTQLNTELEVKLAQVRQEYSRAHESWLDEAKRLEAEAACLREACDVAESYRKQVVQVTMQDMPTDFLDESHSRLVCALDNALSTTAGRSLLAKLETAITALDKLSKLGNEPLPGNSEGNRIAQKALDSIRS